VKISRAKVCIQCDELFTQEACPVCGRDDNWVWLDSWVPAMKRHPETEAEIHAKIINALVREEL